MKKLFTVIALLTLSTLLFAQKAGDKISFTATDFEGNPVTSEIFAKNKLTMVNIWGTFCGPCIREMPDLARINEENKAKGIEVIGIVIDILDNKGQVSERVKTSGEKIIKIHRPEAAQKKTLSLHFRHTLRRNRGRSRACWAGQR